MVKLPKWSKCFSYPIFLYFPIILEKSLVQPEWFYVITTVLLYSFLIILKKKTVLNNGLVISVASKKMLASSLPGRMIIVNTSNHISWFVISKQNKWRLCWFGQRITTLPPYHDWPHDKIYTIRSTTEPDKLMRHHQYTIITSITSHKYYYHSLITLVQFPTRTISNLSQKYIYICIIHWLPL